MRLFAVILITIMSIVFPTDNDIGQQDVIPEEILDGYRNDSSNENAAKTVESCEITDFSLVFSTLSWVDEENLQLGIYRLEAKKGHETVSVKCEFISHDGESKVKEFSEDVSFLQELDAVIKEYNLAAFNGKSVFVSGLPEMYGEEITVLYDSGEHIYASDNQDGFIPKECLYQIYKLFYNNENAFVD